MGDTYRDPVDHLRTTRPLAGESLIDVVHWPGYLLIVAGVVGGVGALAAFGTGHHAEGMTFGVVAIVVTVVGLAWLAFEHRRIRKIADRWYTEHPEVRRRLDILVRLEIPASRGFTGSCEWVSRVHHDESRPCCVRSPLPAGPTMTDQLEDQTQGGSTVDRSLPGGCMADSDLPTKGRQRGVRAVELNVAARLENLALLRTLVGAIGTFEDLDFDAVADLRLAVDEVCTRLIRSALPDATLRLVVDPRKDEVVVEASAACDTHDVVAPGSFSWHVLTALADDVQTFHDGRQPDVAGSVFGITLTARRAASSR